MLTISAPIEIKAKTSYVLSSEAFYHRILGGYALMETNISQEDLLHITSTAPEVYVEEGTGISNIITNNFRNENNISKINILNNVLNRILLSTDIDLTYQDRVFITDALYKLGIKDDRRFMKAFNRMALETRNTNTLINLYLDRADSLNELVQEIETRQKEITKSEIKEKESQKDNYLYNRVMDRLNTGAVYQIVSNFNRTFSDSEVDYGEYALSNQSYLAQNLLLSVLRARAGEDANDLIFFNSNIYEDSLENMETEVSDVKNEITSAVFMELVKNLYHTSFERFYENREAYYRFENTFYKASDKTINKLVTDAKLTYLERTETVVIPESTEKSSEPEKELITHTQEEKITDEEIQRITEAVNRMELQNEERRQLYEKELEKIIKENPVSEGEGGLEQTRRDAILSLSDPEKLKEKLSERRKRQVKKQSSIMNEIKHLLPLQYQDIYSIVNDINEGDANVINNNTIRKADVAELIHDIRTFGEPQPQSQTGQKKSEEVINTTEVVKKETQVDQINRREIEQMITNGVRSQVDTISNQVIRKIEKQFKNEKMRRGY